MMNTITNHCACGKVLALNEQDARRIVKRIQKRKGESNEVRYYQCQFGATHWTQNVHQQKRAS